MSMNESSTHFLQQPSEPVHRAPRGRGDRFTDPCSSERLIITLHVHPKPSLEHAAAYDMNDSITSLLRRFTFNGNYRWYFWSNFPVWKLWRFFFLPSGITSLEHSEVDSWKNWIQVCRNLVVVRWQWTQLCTTWRGWSRFFSLKFEWKLCLQWTNIYMQETAPTQLNAHGLHLKRGEL